MYRRSVLGVLSLHVDSSACEMHGVARGGYIYGSVKLTGQVWFYFIQLSTLSILWKLIHFVKGIQCFSYCKMTTDFKPTVETAESVGSVPENNELAYNTVSKHKHEDEAYKVFDSYSGDQTWTEQEEKQLRRKVDWRLMPLLCITYGLQYYDKSMLSQAVSLISIAAS